MKIFILWEDICLSSRYPKNIRIFKKLISGTNESNEHDLSRLNSNKIVENLVR